MLKDSWPRSEDRVELSPRNCCTVQARQIRNMILIYGWGQLVIGRKQEVNQQIFHLVSLDQNYQHFRKMYFNQQGYENAHGW